MVSIDIKPTGIKRGWSEIFRMTNNDKDGAEGSRIPMIKFRPGDTRLHISFSISGNGNRHFDSAALPMNKYSTVVIQQRNQYGNKYRYSIDVNGVEIYQIMNSKPQDWTNAKMYMCSNFFEESDAVVKNLRFQNIG